MSEINNGAVLTDPIRGVSDAADGEFEEHVLEKVTKEGDYFTLSFDGSWCFGLAASYGIVPKVGQTIRIYGRGFGYPVRGIAIDGVIAYHLTRAEQEAKQLADVEASNAKMRAKFETNREDHDRRIAALPAPFRARFARFLSHNPDFRWKFEDYELFSCEEAVKFARAAADAKGAASPVEWLRAFSAAGYDEQRRLVPGMSDGHSGNTFGMSCQLARAYLENESLVPKMHGALANLVGCAEYGCPPTGESSTSTAEV